MWKTSLTNSTKYIVKLVLNVCYPFLPQPEWVRTKEYWDRGFEERFEAQKKDKQRPPLKVSTIDMFQL